MFSLDTLRELHDHMEWADARVWSVALRSAAASRDVPLHDKLVHVHHTQRAYLRMWTDRPQVPPAAQGSDGILAIRAWARPYYAETRTFLEAADPSLMEAPVPELFHRRLEQELGQGRARITLGETVFDVVNHAAHHRGQLNTRLRELREEPPHVDYVAWVWYGRPVADWISS